MATDFPSQPRLRLALVGCGRVAARVHLPILARLDGCEIVAVAEGDPSRRRAAQQIAPQAELVDDYGTLLDRDDVEAIVICLPTGTHAEAAVAGFEAGKHVYLEKPIATTAGDAEHVVAAWRTSGRVGQTGFNYRFHPLHEALRRRLADREVGDVVAVRTVFTSAARTLPSWKRGRSTGGGALLDLLSHHADLLAFHLGQPVAEVNCRTRSVASEGDTASITMRLADGTVAETFVSTSAVEEDRFEVIGNAGKLSLDRHAGRLIWSPARTYAPLPDRVFKMFGAMGSSFGELRQQPDPSFATALRHFIECCRDNRQPDVTIEDGQRSLGVILAAEESAGRGGTAVAVPGAPAVAEANLAERSTLADLSSVASEIDDPQRPAMSVILVTVTTFATLRKTVQHLAQQSVVNRLELILVAPKGADLDDLRPEEAKPFFKVTKLGVGEIADVDKIAAQGIRAASGPIVALLEDHAYPQAGWAERVIDAHRGGEWAAVGTAINNANPDSVLSWANMLLSYGEWVAAQDAGETQSVSRHNVTFKTKALVETYGDDLENYMGRDGGLLGDLLARGYQYYLEPRASVIHVNPSKWSSTIELRVGSGRLYGARRARSERWSRGKRWTYAVLWPLIPVVRWPRLRTDLFTTNPQRRQIVGGKAIPAMAVGLILDGIGQGLGYAFGPGRAGEKLAFFEMGRARHLRRGDRPIMDTEAVS